MASINLNEKQIELVKNLIKQGQSSKLENWNNWNKVHLGKLQTTQVHYDLARTTEEQENDSFIVGSSTVL